VGPRMWDPPSCERLLYSCCIGVVNLTFSISAQLQGILRRDLILVQHQYNNCTTTLHMRVDPIMWDPSSCEGLLYSCCIGVVNLTFFIYIYRGVTKTLVTHSLLCWGGLHFMLERKSV
jgi:hypothetical protein